MYYVYILIHDEIPFYVGITREPENRYRRHCSYDECGAYNYIKYKLAKDGKLPTMKVVFCWPNIEYVKHMEEVAIYRLQQNGFVLCNYRSAHPLKTIPKRPICLSSTKHLITKQVLEHVTNSKKKVLKEYNESQSLDLNVWVTQQALADEMNIPVQNVHNWVQRNKIEWVVLPGSTTKLVNKTTLSVDHSKGRYS